MIIKLTKILDEDKLYLNANNIIAFAQYNGSTTDWLSPTKDYTQIRSIDNRIYEVKETPDEIIKLINKTNSF